MHALYALDGLKALEPADVLAALDDPEPRVREHALRLAEPFCEDGPRFEHGWTRLTDDPDLRVRYQLAFSLGALPGRDAGRGAGRAGGPRRGRPLDPAGDPQLRRRTAPARSSACWPATRASAPRRTAAHS